MLNAVKEALRISHNRLDNTLWTDIQAAQAELIRAGVSPTAVEDTAEPLIKTAIITFVKADFARNLDEAGKYQQSFQYQLDNLRKSSKYTEAEADGE